MREAFRQVLICCVAVGALARSALSETTDLTPLQRFEREAPPAWSKLIELASCVQGEVSSTKIDRTTGKVISREAASVFRINGLLAYISLRADAKNRIECQNLDYEFIVDEVGAKRWVVKQLLRGDRNAQEFAKERYFDPRDGTIEHQPWQLALASACRGLLVNITWLPHLASSPEFKVVEATNVTDAAIGGSLIRVKFRNQALRHPGLNIENGEFILDPKRYWQILRARITAHEGHEGPRQLDMVFDIKNNFEVADNLVPYVRWQTLRKQTLPAVDSDIPKLDREIIYETKMTLKDRAAVQPFRLPAFGLPEPPKAPTKSRTKR